MPVAAGALLCAVRTDLATAAFFAQGLLPAMRTGLAFFALFPGLHAAHWLLNRLN
jgi:hypothetical protein